TLAYQGAGRGLDDEQLHSVLAFATGGQSADLSILVEVPVEVARRRIKTSQPDRLERLDGDFHGRVSKGYRSLAQAEPDAWLIVDGTGAVDQVAEAIALGVDERLGGPVR
ncbi:MAG: dTMP kinase, partial [Acidimicrobiales bacterium]